MLITNDFIFHFEGEDVNSKLRETYLEDWLEEAAKRQWICLKDDLFVLIYPKGSKPTRCMEEQYFQSFMLGFIFLAEVDPKRNETYSTSLNLTTHSCLALSEYYKRPIESFFYEYYPSTPNDFSEENNDNPTIIPGVIKSDWSEISDKTLDRLLAWGWIYRTKFDPSLIESLPEEKRNDDIFKLTSIFLEHFDDFEIKQF